MSGGSKRQMQGSVFGEPIVHLKQKTVESITDKGEWCGYVVTYCHTFLSLPDGDFRFTSNHRHTTCTMCLENLADHVLEELYRRLAHNT